MDKNSLLFAKWLAFFEIEAKERKEIIDSLHEEIIRGFDVISVSALEELEYGFSDKEFFKKINSTLKLQLGYLVLGGYMLYLMENHINPLKISLRKNRKTDSLGMEWMAQYNSDRCKGLLGKIDFIMTLLLEKGVQGRLNNLFLEHPDCMEVHYKQIGMIERFFNWTAYQGYSLALLEKQLSAKKGK